MAEGEAETDRRKDGQQRDRIDEIREEYLGLAARNKKTIDEIGERYHMFARRATVLLAALVLVTLGSGFLSVYLLGQNDKRTKDIQRSRVDLTRASCNAQNARHDATIAELQVLIKHAQPQAGETKAQQTQQINDTILFIDALVPHQNCKALVKRLKIP